MTRMRIAWRWFIVAAVSLAIVWGWCLLDLLFPRPNSPPNWLDSAYFFTFAIGHLLTFVASVATAVYGVSALVRTTEVRRIANYCITATAILVGAFLSFILFNFDAFS